MRSASPYQPFPFLSLPRELRDHVYAHVIEADLRPRAERDPATVTQPEQNIDRSRATRDDISPGPCHTGYTSFGALCSNRQIAHELREKITLINMTTPGVTCVLDCVLPEWHGRISTRFTWLELPAPARYIKTVVVQLRTSAESGTSVWGNGGPSRNGQDLMKLLSRFLAYGPSFRPGYIKPGTIHLYLLELIFLSKRSPNPPGCHRVPQGLEPFCRQLDYRGLVCGKIRRVRLRLGYEELLVRPHLDSCRLPSEEQCEFEVRERSQAGCDARLKEVASYGWHVPAQSDSM